MSSMKDHYHDEISNNHDQSEAWQTGYEAAKHGESLIDNPYEKTLWTHDQWYLGFRDYTITNQESK